MLSEQNQVAGQNQVADQFGNRILAHYRANPFRMHLVAWLFVSVAFAWAMIPDYSVPAILGFGIASLVASGLLCIVTYPVSGHYSFTIFGAIVGVVMVPLLGCFGFLGSNSLASTNGQAIQLCLLVGALIGSSSSIWQIPLRLWGIVQDAAIANSGSGNRSPAAG